MKRKRFTEEQISRFCGCTGRERRLPISLPQAANQRWSLDFVADQLANGRRFRTL